MKIFSRFMKAFSPSTPSSSQIPMIIKKCYSVVWRPKIRQFGFVIQWLDYIPQPKTFTCAPNQNAPKRTVRLFVHPSLANWLPGPGDPNKVIQAYSERTEKVTIEISGKDELLSHCQRGMTFLTAGSKLEYKIEIFPFSPSVYTIYSSNCRFNNNGFFIIGAVIRTHNLDYRDGLYFRLGRMTDLPPHYVDVLPFSQRSEFGEAMGIDLCVRKAVRDGETHVIFHSDQENLIRYLNGCKPLIQLHPFTVAVLDAIKDVCKSRSSFFFCFSSRVANMAADLIGRISEFYGDGSCSWAFLLAQKQEFESNGEASSQISRICYSLVEVLEDDKLQRPRFYVCQK